MREHAAQGSCFSRSILFQRWFALFGGGFGGTFARSCRPYGCFDSGPAFGGVHPFLYLSLVKAFAKVPEVQGGRSQGACP